VREIKRGEFLPGESTSAKQAPERKN